MGVKNSRELKIYDNGKVGCLTIDIGKDKNYYFPGQTLNGQIWITLFEDVEVCGLDLKLQMQEVWYFKQDKNAFHETNVQNLIEMSVDILNSVKLTTQGTYSLLKGSHCFPFTFIVPYYLSPSFEFFGILGYLYIRYVVYSCLQSTKGEKFCLSNLNYLIVQSGPKSLSSPLAFSSVINVHSWLIFEKGTCALNVNFALNKNNYAYGEYIKLKCMIDNTRSKLKVKRLKMCVIQRIIFKDVLNNHINMYENTFQVKELLLALNQGDIISDYPVELPLLNFKINPEIYTQDRRTPYTHLFKDSNDIFKFQPSVPCSTLVVCEYYIKVSVHFDAVVSYKNRPRVYMPFLVTHRAVEEVESFDFSDVVVNANNKNFENLEKIECKINTVDESKINTVDKSKNINIDKEIQITNNNNFNDNNFNDNLNCIVINRDSINGPYVVEDINAIDMNYTNISNSSNLVNYPTFDLKEPLLNKK